MGTHAEGEVRFPYQQALELAAALWKTGTDIGGTYQPDRMAAAKVALDGWLGRFAQTFAGNMNTSNGEGTSLESSMRSAAEGLAAQWVEAKTQQQRNDWAKLVQQKRDSRGWGTKVEDSVFGDDTKYGSPPTPPTQPSPPDFAPTPVAPATLS